MDTSPTPVVASTGSPPAKTPVAEERPDVAIAAATEHPSASVATIPPPSEKIASSEKPPLCTPLVPMTESPEKHTPLEATTSNSSFPTPTVTQTPIEEPVKVPPAPGITQEPAVTDLQHAVGAATEEVQTHESPVAMAEKPTSDLPVDPLPSTAESPDEKHSAIPHAQTEPDRELPPPSTETLDTSLYVEEESYYLRDLKESQKKALLEFKAKIQAAIMDNSFLEPPKPAKAINTEKKEAAKDEEKKGGEAEKSEEKKVDKDVSDNVIVQSEPTINNTDEVAAPELPPVTEAECKRHDATREPTSTTREIHVDVMHEPITTIDDALTAPPVDDSPSLDDLALWGVPLLHSKGDERTDVLLLKFLRARDFKADKALNMLQDTMAWRKDFNTDSLIEEETPADFHSSFIHGLDLNGHPVCYNGELSSTKSVGDEAQLKRRIQVLEKGIQGLDFHPNGVHSMVQVIDFAGHSPAFLGRGARSKILNLLQDNYPELVAKQIFINVPWYFKALRYFDIISPRTKSKAVIARPGRVSETLFKYISPDQVPVQYGGLSRLNDADFEGTNAPVNQMTIKAGKKQSIELPVTDAGRVVWDIAVTGWDVLYDEEFVPNEGYTRIIRRKTSKVATLEEPIRNAFNANEPGKVVLTVDNSTSRRKKVAVYRHIIKPHASG